MKQFAGIMLCLILLLSAAGCAQADDTQKTHITPEQTESISESTAPEETIDVESEITVDAPEKESFSESVSPEEPADEETETAVDTPAKGSIIESTAPEEPADEGTDTPDNALEKELKLYINDTGVPVTWENNAAVTELMEEAANGDIIVSMSMYGGWEQVGSLGRDYSRNDSQMTAVNGDIVLYSGDQIVVFYGSNSWAYTKLGKMNLSEDEVSNLLSNGEVTLTLRLT